VRYDFAEYGISLAASIATYGQMPIVVFGTMASAGLGKELAVVSGIQHDPVLYLM